MATKKTYLLARVSKGSIEKPFVLKFAVASEAPEDGPTSVFADTARTEGDPLASAMPSGETVSATHSGGGDFADTSF